MKKNHLVYSNDGYQWFWHRKSEEDEDGYYNRYCMTNSDGEGLFVMDRRRGELHQVLGTCQFSLRGLKDPRRKIRDYMNPHE